MVTECGNCGTFWDDDSLSFELQECHVCGWFPDGEPDVKSCDENDPFFDDMDDNPDDDERDY